MVQKHIDRNRLEKWHRMLKNFLSYEFDFDHSHGHNNVNVAQKTIKCLNIGDGYKKITSGANDGKYCNILMYNTFIAIV